MRLSLCRYCQGLPVMDAAQWLRTGDPARPIECPRCGETNELTEDNDVTIMVQDVDQAEAWQSGMQEDSGPIPIGDHVAEIVGIDEGKTQNGNPQLIIQWQGPGGSTSREWLVVVAATLGKVRALLEAVGFPIPSGSFAMPTSELIGRRALISVREHTYNGKTGVKVMGHRRPDAVPIQTDGLPVPKPVAVPDNDALPF